ncbi:MAG: hypothetical protein AAFX06_22115 [Planctomycetota bacterium]
MIRWLVGLSIGTCLIAVTSPLFVRSYVPREVDSLRKVAVLQPGSTYRWRREGYATTAIGPHGMFGVDSVESNATLTLALWGDSQAEGACVADHEKIATMVKRLGDGSLHVLSFARSGDDCNDWIAQIPRVESAIGIDAHVFLVSEFSDWQVDVAEPNEHVDERLNGVSRFLPDFVVQAARNVVVTGNGDTRRVLRFRPGPMPSHDSLQASNETDAETDSLDAIRANVERVRDSTTKHCLFVLATEPPDVATGGGELSNDSRTARAFGGQQEGLGRLDLIDLTSTLQSSPRASRGFQNGQLGVGHLNAQGNRIIAQGVVEHFRDTVGKD